jgi:hypothetical protein
MCKDRVMPLDPYNLEVARVLAREFSSLFRTLEIVRRPLHVYWSSARKCRSSKANGVAIERPGTLRVARMESPYLKVPPFGMFRVAVEGPGRYRQARLRGITKLLGVAASRVGIAIGLPLQSVLDRPIRPFREIAVGLSSVQSRVSTSSHRQHLDGAPAPYSAWCFNVSATTFRTAASVQHNSHPTAESFLFAPPITHCP